MSDFVECFLELLAPLKNVWARKMFGGYGIFKQDLMFGLVADEVWYLKVDQETIPDYKALELGSFAYEGKGKKMAMSYYQAPEEAMDSSSALCEWAEKAYRAALGAKQKIPGSSSNRKPCASKKAPRELE